VSKRKKISFSKKKLWCKTKEQHYTLFGAKEEKKKEKGLTREHVTSLF
jgi:hypothetical protein